MIREATVGLLSLFLLAIPVRGADAASPEWADGFSVRKVRFIRLQYKGKDWDDGMKATENAEVNLLRHFSDAAGGMEVAKMAESHPIRMLKKYPKGAHPAFVYMTGSGRISGVEATDMKILREYLLNDGMLFADCGSPQWDRTFRAFIREVMQVRPLRPIPGNDPILQVPFALPGGAPPLWHHGGTQLMGVRHGERWVVVYHPGDLNDAWKTGHSGLRPAAAEDAYRLGVNVIYHALLANQQLRRAAAMDSPVVRRITAVAEPEEIPDAPDPNITPELDALDRERK